MSDTLKIDGKELFSIKDAARLTGYSRDYVARLAREKNITAAYIGRKWFVDLSSLKSYIESVTLEKEIRKKRLSEERKRERELRNRLLEENTVRLKKVHAFNIKAAAATGVVASLGILVGVFVWRTVPLSFVYSDFGYDDRPRPAQLAQVNYSLEDNRKEEGLNSVISSARKEREIQTSATAGNIWRSLGEIDRGIILFPAATTTLGRVFSDPVTIVTLANGSKAVVLTDENGNRSGEPIPVVEIPVKADGS